MAKSTKHATGIERRIVSVVLPICLNALLIYKAGTSTLSDPRDEDHAVLTDGICSNQYRHDADERLEHIAL